MKKKHGNISRHRHVHKNNCVFTAIPFYIQEMAVCFPITKQKEPIIIRFISCDYRLCVNASGSVITKILNFSTLIKVSCLHLGQNKGKFFSSVSNRSLIRVLLLQTGHSSHSKLSISFISNFPERPNFLSCDNRTNRNYHSQ